MGFEWVRLMSIEILPKPSNPPKKTDFGNWISSGYACLVNSEGIGSEFQFFRFSRVLLTPKHETVIMKEKSNLYLEGYNGTSDLVLLNSKGSKKQICFTCILFSCSVFHISACQTWDKIVLFCHVSYCSAYQTYP